MKQVNIIIVTVFPIFKDVKGNCNNLLDINQKSMINMKEKSKELANTAKKFTLGNCCSGAYNRNFYNQLFT